MKKYIPGFDSYEIDEEGNVFVKGKPKEILYDTKGRPYVTIWDVKKNYQVKKYISYLVAMTFLGESDDPTKTVLCYRDKNPANVELNNLYWGTRSKLLADSYEYRLIHQDSRDLKVRKTLDIHKIVYQVDPKTLAVVNSYQTVKEASKAMDVPFSAIVNACYNDKETCCHYRWCFDYQYKDLR